MNEIISQILGVVVTLLCLVSSQMKRKWQMCCVTVTANLMSAVGMMLVGAFSAMGCCFVAIAQAILRIWHLHKNTRISKVEIALFSVLYVAGGLLPYVVAGTLGEFGWLDVMPIVGALMLMVSIAQKREQPSRAFALVNGVIYFLYNLIIWNTQMLAQLAGIASNTIALIRYSRKDKRCTGNEN